MTSTGVVFFGIVALVLFFLTFISTSPTFFTETHQLFLMLIGMGSVFLLVFHLRS